MPEAQYLLICGGDGYCTQVVPESDLERAFLALLFDESELVEMSAQARDVALRGLRDRDANWLSDYPVGATHYQEEYEDGYIEVIRLSPLAPEGELRGQLDKAVSDLKAIHVAQEHSTLPGGPYVAHGVSIALDILERL